MNRVAVTLICGLLLATSCTSPSDRPTRPEPTRKPITSEASSTIRPLVALQMPAPTDESKADQQETAVEPERAVLTRRANAQQNPPGENGTRMGLPANTACDSTVPTTEVRTRHWPNRRLSASKSGTYTNCGGKRRSTREGHVGRARGRQGGLVHCQPIRTRCGVPSAKLHNRTGREASPEFVKRAGRTESGSVPERGRTIRDLPAEPGPIRLGARGRGMHLAWNARDWSADKKHREPRPINEAYYRAQDAERTAEFAVQAYCTKGRDELPDTLWEHQERNPETRRILACLVGLMGGPDRFIAANLQRSTVLEELEHTRTGRGPCAPSR